MEDSVLLCFFLNIKHCFIFHNRVEITQARRSSITYEKRQEVEAGGRVPGLVSFWNKSINHSGPQVFHYKRRQSLGANTIPFVKVFCISVTFLNIAFPTTDL